MEFQKPAFSPDNPSVICTVTALHSYFRNLQAYYKVLRGQVISELEYTDKPEKIGDLKIKLNEINRKIKYVHVLNNSASTVDEIVHLEDMLSEFRPSEEVVKV
ncbi:MAG: hypothetical protein QNJ72_32320 [Pleurocapsa sp. MO_226.B13]|nr:hypothetical protein [Pleurocapsa sp. MO_226.B13]